MMNTWSSLLNELISFKTNSGLIVTNYKDILYCSADGSYTVIHSSDHPEFMISLNLGSLQNHLPEQLFIRVHHKFLVNKLHVRKVSTIGNLHVILSNGKQLKISSRKKKIVVKGFIKFQL